jgi:hypothetical protein
MNITINDAGWIITALLLGGAVLGGIQDWLAGQYEVTRGGRLRFRVTRRWYGARAWVVLRREAGWDEPERFRVLRQDDENSSVPWLQVQSIDDDAAEAFWAPVTGLAPYAVRRLRPWLFRYGRLRLPVLFAYEPVSRPAGDSAAERAGADVAALRADLAAYRAECQQAGWPPVAPHRSAGGGA